MKTIKKTVAIMIVVLIAVACGSEEIQNDVSGIEVSSENLATTDFAIEGMVCAMGCAAAIQEEVASLNGVVVSNVDYEAKKAHFEFDESVVSKKDIVAKIEEIADGQYKVGEWTQDETSIEVNEEIQENETKSKDKSITKVSLPSFEVPNLFNLLMDQI